MSRTLTRSAENRARASLAVFFNKEIVSRTNFDEYPDERSNFTRTIYFRLRQDADFRVELRDLRV